MLGAQSQSAASRDSGSLLPQVKVEQMALELRLTPLTVLLRSVLDQLQDKDPARIFAQPVSLTEVGVRAQTARHCCSSALAHTLVLSVTADRCISR